MSADTLIVMLPGALMTPQHYLDAGFGTALAQSAHAADLQLAEYDTEQFNIDTLVDQVLPALHRQIIRPARQQGYRRVVLGGISLGGMMALQYVRRFGHRYPGDVNGLCLIAPYPGSGLITGPILAAGGLLHWRPDAEQARDPEFQLWHWLAQGALRLPVYFGYGREDRFAHGMAMMAAALPAARVHVVPGAHDWTPWRALWDDFLVFGLGAV